MENNSVSKLILAFVVLVIGVSLIGTVANQTNAAVDKVIVYNETFDISSARLADGCGIGSINATYPFTVANAPSGWQADGGCPIASVVVRNQTHDTAVVTTDYVFFTSNGTFFLKNDTETWLGLDCQDTAQDNVTSVDYTYCADGYMNIGWGRSILTLVSGFFALALLGASIALFYSVAKDSGMIN